MKPIPLFGNGVRSYSEVVTAQRRLNCFFDLRTDGEKSELVLRGTPGSILWQTVSTTPIRGWRTINDVLYLVSGSALYKVTTAGVVTNLGSVSSTNGYLSMSDNGIELGIVDGTFGYILTLATGVMVQISDPNFPNGATTIAFINGRFIVNKINSRQFYVSQSYAGATWTPVVFATKENSSDLLVAVEVLNGMVILWGSESVEFWQDVGGASLPYARINGATQTVGLAAVWSRTRINNTVMFLGKNPDGNLQVFRLSGYTPERVSTSDIESIITGFILSGTTVSDAVALTYMVDGHPMYQITFPSASRSFLFDDLSKMWQEVQTGLGLRSRHYADLGIVFNSLNYVSDYQSGNIYQLSMNSETDNGAYIKRQFTSRHVRNSGNPFSIDELYIDMETGVGLQNGQGSDPKIMLQVSKDGGRTFGVERWKSVGKVGQYRSPRVIWNRMGQAVDFVFQFTMTDPVKFIITSAYASSIDGG